MMRHFDLFLRPPNNSIISSIVGGEPTNNALGTFRHTRSFIKPQGENAGGCQM
jgi:hypothetical protein